MKQQQNSLNLNNFVRKWPITKNINFKIQKKITRIVFNVKFDQACDQEGVLKVSLIRLK